MSKRNVKNHLHEPERRPRRRPQGGVDLYRLTAIELRFYPYFAGPFAAVSSWPVGRLCGILLSLGDSGRYHVVYCVITGIFCQEIC